MFSDNEKCLKVKTTTREYHIPELVVACEKSPAEVIREIDCWITGVGATPEKSGFIKKLAYETQHGLDDSRGFEEDFRVAVTAYTERELEKKLLQLRKMVAEEPEVSFSYPAAGMFYGHGKPLGRTAFLFPGQGSQYLGMGGPLASAFAAARQVWERLGTMRFNGKTINETVFPDEMTDERKIEEAFLKLSGADWTNPCISVAGEAILTLFKKMGLRPDAVAAHSFGDISAYRAAGILAAADMIKATRYRGKLGVTCPLATRGCVLIVLEGAEKINAVLEENRLDEVWIANYNTRRQTVLSGIRDAVYKAHGIFEAKGINSRLIPISGAPHCPLAVGVADKFSQYLTSLNFKQADCDVYSFLFGRKVGNDPSLFRKLLKSHIEKPVRFLSQIEQMYNDGIRIFIEIGPSDVLTNLVEQILEDKTHIALCTDRKKGDAVLVFLNAVAELLKEGLINNLEVLWEGYEIPEASHDNLST
ncbi:MAG: ACP S-malonyltransferase [Thermodesulfobacteriota bacterium]|nr:ACP S-malonyltransferase [Thermodesulfobacteriota bacterium]